MQSLSFDALDETGFEEFCFDTLRELGFVNLDWRKGTGLASSPADRGRDIVAHLERIEPDGSTHLETWFADCKHYKKGVPPERLQGLLAWAEAERPHTALFMCSGFLSNPAKDYLKEYEANRHPPFKTRYWERPTLERLTKGKDALLQKYLVLEGLRDGNEILVAEQEFFDRVWYYRKLILAERERGKRIDPAIRNLGREKMKELEELYGKHEMAGPHTDFDWGMINGKLSALRWVLGEDWDFLDT